MSDGRRSVVTAGLAMLAAALLAPAASSLAQQLVGSGGRALDGNLRLGSGGYNGRGGRGGFGGPGGVRPFRETIYRGQHGHIDYYTAFTQQRRYDPGRRTAFHDDPRRFEQGGAASGTIAGGIEVLQLMRVGSRWQIVVPPDMAHGAGGQMPKIGPNETIVGVIELVAIK